MFFFIIFCVCVSNFPTPGDHLPSLPVGGTPPGSSGGGSSVGGDWPVLLSGHGGPAVPHACAEHVWQTVLQVQVTHNIQHSYSNTYCKVKKKKKKDKNRYLFEKKIQIKFQIKMQFTDSGF